MLGRETNEKTEKEQKEYYKKELQKTKKMFSNKYFIFSLFIILILAISFSIFNKFNENKLANTQTGKEANSSSSDLYLSDEPIKPGDNMAVGSYQKNDTAPTDSIFDYTPVGDMTTSTYIQAMEAKQTPGFIKAFTNPQITDDTILTLKKYSANNKNYYDYYAEYPVFTNFSNIKEQNELNKVLETMSKNHILNLFKNVSPDPDDYQIKWTNSKVYQSYYKNDRLASVIFNLSNYQGGDHGISYTEPFNYDFVLHKELKLDDIFSKNINYLKFLSDYCYKDFVRQMGDSRDDGWVKSGVEPSEDNFNSFSFDDGGLTFYFAPYQVDSFAAGEQTVFISYDELKSVIKPVYIVKN